MLAERFGRSPEEVENWDVYWYERAVTWLEGESLAQKQERKSAKGPARRR